VVAFESARWRTADKMLADFPTNSMALALPAKSDCK
jgi:hypothetical protein